MAQPFTADPPVSPTYLWWDCPRFSAAFAPARAESASLALPLTSSTTPRTPSAGPVLERAVCAVTHGGMGATVKALDNGVPVCVVPFGRDQHEVAMRVKVAGCGTRLSARRLTPDRLRKAVLQAMTMTRGAHRVAEGFAATGGIARAADLIEQLTRVDHRV